MEEYYRQNTIEFAILQLNKPYIWGSTGPDEFDCSGLTYYIFKELFNIDINKKGYGIGDTTKQLTNNLGNTIKYKEKNFTTKNIQTLNKGDLIFFHTQSLDENRPTPENRYPGHIGIYIGNNEFIHASSKAKKVIISTLTDEWTNKIIATKNIINSIIETK